VGSAFERRVDAVRAFNRFYTRRIGVLDEAYLGSRFSLTEIRVLYELAHREAATASELARVLGLDAGYLSRILNSFTRGGVIAKSSATDDARKTILRLTARGRRVIEPLEAKARAQIGAMLDDVPVPQQGRVIDAMRAIETSLAGSELAQQEIRLRSHRPGDLGWVVERHGSLYWQEYGWDETFEALVAGIVANFIEHLDPERERCWIAERDREPVGCVFCVRKSKRVAKLRLLLVEPRARGLGIGRRLVDECIGFARGAGYRELTLWTNDVLVAARHIYERAGFGLVESKRHHSFGKNLVGQNWTLRL